MTRSFGRDSARLRLLAPCLVLALAVTLWPGCRRSDGPAPAGAARMLRQPPELNWSPPRDTATDGENVHGLIRAVTIGRDARASVLQRVGETLRWSLTVPRAPGPLKAGLGVFPSADGGVRISVIVRPRGGGSRTFQLVNRLLEGEAAPEWIELEADLADWAGQEIVLELSAHPAGAARSSAGVVAWANPRVEVGTGARWRRRKNFVLVSLDTLRADHMSAYGYGRRTTPCIDAWAQRSAVLFETVVAPSPWTLPSHTSIFTGLDAVRHGANYRQPAPSGLETLAETLFRAGYATAAATEGGYLNPRFGLAQGFERYVWTRGDREDAVERTEAKAASLLAGVAGRPFFLFVHTYEVHDPYRRREPYHSRWSDSPDSDPVRLRFLTGLDPDRFLHRYDFVRQSEEPGSLPTPDAPPVPLAEVVALYDAGVARADQAVCRILGEVQRLGLAEDTVVIITSDHGEMLGEHGLAGHHTLFDPNLLVPLIIGRVGGRTGRHVQGQVGSVDLFPTILELAGLPVPAGLDGVSLKPWLGTGALEPPERDVWSYAASSGHGIAVRTRDGVKYIRRNSLLAPHAGREEIYDLLADPGESENLVDTVDAGPLRARAIRLQARWLSGLRISLYNDSELPQEIQVDGTDIGLSVKAADWNCGCAPAITADSVRLSVPAQSTADFTIEDVPERLRLRLARSGEGRAAMIVELEPSSLEEHVMWFADRGSGWRRSPAEDSRAAVIPGTALASVAWRAAGAGTVPPAGMDRELRRELRALGYIR